MMKPMEAIGSVPQEGVNPSSVRTIPDPRVKYGLTDEDFEFFRNDPEVIAVVQAVTGRDFPMEQVDDILLAEIAGAVQKLGVQGAIAEAQRILTPEIKAQIRGTAMKQRMPRIGGGA